MSKEQNSGLQNPLEFCWTFHLRLLIIDGMVVLSNEKLPLSKIPPDDNKCCRCSVKSVLVLPPFYMAWQQEFNCHPQKKKKSRNSIALETPLFKYAPTSTWCGRCGIHSYHRWSILYHPLIHPSIKPADARARNVLPSCFPLLFHLFFSFSLMESIA